MTQVGTTPEPLSTSKITFNPFRKTMTPYTKAFLFLTVVNVTVSFACKSVWGTHSIPNLFAAFVFVGLAIYNMVT